MNRVVIISSINSSLDCYNKNIILMKIIINDILK